MWGRRPGGTSRLAVLISLGIVCLVLFTLYVREDETGPLHTVQLGAAEVLRPVRSAVATIARPLEYAGNTAGNLLDENGEERTLREKSLENQELAARNASLAQENEQLRSLLEGEREPYEYAPLARVVAPVGGQFTERIVIDAGTEEGVKPEQPVIVGNNTLVGRTTGRVTANTAEVMLVTDQSFAAGVRIVPPATFDPSTGETTIPEATTEETTTEETTGEETTTEETTIEETTASPPTEEAFTGEGLLRTTTEGYLGVELVPLDAAVGRDDFVITSGRAGEWELLFPPGLLVGTVESVSSEDIDQYQKIVVTPAVRPDDLEEVRVITDW